MAHDTKMEARERAMRRTTEWRLRVVGLLAMLALVMLLAAAGVQAQDSGGKVLRIHQVTYPDTIDPQYGSALAEISIWSLNYEALTRCPRSSTTTTATTR